MGFGWSLSQNYFSDEEVEVFITQGAIQFLFGDEFLVYSNKLIVQGLLLSLASLGKWLETGRLQSQSPGQDVGKTHKLLCMMSL